MIRTVGNITLLSFFLVATLVADELSVQITDMHDMPTNSVDVGTPFKIKVSAHGIAPQAHELTLQGLEQAVVDGHQQQISIINGVRSCVHTYCARIDTSGTYTIGPARADHRGTVLESGTVSLTVTKPRAKAENKKEAYFARLTCEKEAIFIGEKVYCHIYFYAKSPDARLTNLLAPSFNAKVENTQYQGPFESLETIQGVQYICRHVQWLCCPKSVGEFVIPAYTVVYTLPADSRADFGGFSAFFGMRPIQQAVYTNATSIQVKPLPPYTGQETVQGLGAYERFALIVKQKSVQVGQALEVSLQLTGAADNQAVVSPSLQGLPGSCKQYPSQTTTTPINDTLSTTTFDYILQATEAGSLQIPAQRFTFFDTKTGRYKTLRTKAHEVVVTPAPVQSAAVSNNDDGAHEQAAATSEHDATKSLTNKSVRTDECSLIYEGWQPYVTQSLPRWLLMLLFLLPPLITSAYFLYHALTRFFRQRHTSQRSERAFSNARTMLRNAEKKRAYDQLYPLFVTLLADRSANKQVPVDQVVRDCLLNAGFTHQIYDEWQQFFAECAAFVFLGNGVREPDPLIFKQAHYWLGILEQAL